VKPGSQANTRSYKVLTTSWPKQSKEYACLKLLVLCLGSACAQSGAVSVEALLKKFEDFEKTLMSQSDKVSAIGTSASGSLTFRVHR